MSWLLLCLGEGREVLCHVRRSVLAPCESPRRKSENERRDTSSASSSATCEVTRALSKLALLKTNQRAIVDSETLHIVIEMLGASEDSGEGSVSLGVKQEALELLCPLSDLPECLSTLVSDGALAFVLLTKMRHISVSVDVGLPPLEKPMNRLYVQQR